MSQSVAPIAPVVRDYDEALAFQVGKVGFRRVGDTALPEQHKRWAAAAAAPGRSGASLLLAQASTPAQEAATGNQTGGRVFLFHPQPRVELEVRRRYQGARSVGGTPCAA